VTCEHLERDVDAYIDHELDAESASAIRDHLNTCTICRRRVAERQTLGRLARATQYFSAPDRLRASVTERSRRTWSAWSVRGVLTWAAAAVLMVSVGGGLALVPSGISRNDAAVDEVVAGHVRSLMADHLFDVRSTDQHTVKPWFLGQIDFAPPVVDLSSIGFPLVGGRLDYLGGRPVAALVYLRQKHTINVFIASGTSSARGAIDASSVRGFHVRHWTRDGMSFWAVSDLNDTDLTEFARALQQS